MQEAAPVQMPLKKKANSADAAVLRANYSEYCDGTATTEDIKNVFAMDQQSLKKAKPMSTESSFHQNSQSNSQVPRVVEPNTAPEAAETVVVAETSLPATTAAVIPEVLPASHSTNASNDDIENKSNAKKKKKKGKGEPELPKVEERKAFSISTQLYRFGEHLAMYNRLYQESYPQLLCNNTKFFIETENNGVGCLDLLFTAFCDFMKMEKIKNLPTDGGERVFCWLGKRKATEVLPTLRPEHHFVNRLPLDIYLKDKQSLAFTLQSNTLHKGIQFKEHLCPHTRKRIPCQMLCPHQYARHNMEPCTEPGCFETMSKEARNELGIDKLHDGSMCPCFVSKIFVPETKVFSSSLQQNVFIEDVSRTAPDAHWIVKPSYMRSGRGVRILSSAEQLRTFLKVKTSNRFMWGQNFVVQRYIKNPMLTNTGQKFDIRMFLLIIVTRFKRVLGFLHPGFVRKVPDPYKEMQKNEKFRARQHLAGTRVWRTFGPKIDPATQPPASANNATTTSGDNTSEDVLQTQNNAKKKKNRKPSVELDPLEPINRVGFYAGEFDNDECEEYNFAVRHGCLKGNKQNLPLIMMATKAPELNPKPQKMDKTAQNLDATAQATSTSTVQPSGSASPSVGANSPASTSGAAAAPGTSSAGATVSESGAAGTAGATGAAPAADFDPADVPPGQDPWTHFSTNEAFLRTMRSMVSNICCSVLDQIKEKANCYQVFSLDICIDEGGRPWLLEVNPSIITENVNWNSRTIREVIPGVLVESLALVCEATRKGLSFLALRTPKEFYYKPEDLVFRQNFIWLYSTPDRLCDMFELRKQKYAVEKQFKTDLTSRGISYLPVDYYPEKNKKLVKAMDSEAAKKALDSSANRCTYRFPSPVANVPVLEEDVSFSLRYTRVPLDAIKRQTRVRRMENEVKRQRQLNEEERYRAYNEKRHKPKAMLKERFVLN
ncbi:hypothetical protein BOX15_Mlig005554g1 [Macrostomum lignano]|uniref:ATP-grasp domain-containing protein n=1 Tax=Macrostomum lignano TaxID=282301 RepID=A0A267DMR9_9PLAT|nr:hypothetical protein BOX15_Mlig005554g1 [Macrostomum lignano]